MKALNENALMQRCLELARNGEGKVNPNPMVGCVIERDGRIVGEGFHQCFGGPHAEVIALLHAGKKAKGATLFVNLEPCAHFGKTPPCVDAIIQSGVSKVVIAAKDPNPLVSGKGIQRLRKEGVEVKIGLLQKESALLNEKFFKFMKTGLPYVGIKLAQTLDGRIADVKGKSKWITSKASRKEVHRLRSEYDAILVGANTVIKDNPELTVRLVKGRNPIRIVLDGSLALTTTRKIFNTNIVPTWILTSTIAMKLKHKEVQQLASKGVRVFGVSSSYDLKAKNILRILSAEGVSSVLVEGGACTAAGFIEQSFADKLYLFTAAKILGGGLDGFRFALPKLLNNPTKLTLIDVSIVGEDVIVKAKFNHE